MRRGILALVPLAALPWLLCADAAREMPDAWTTIAATPLPLDLDDPARRRVGALVYEGGWVLRGADPRVGGVSAMAVAADGPGRRRFWLLSDEGRLIDLVLADGARSARAWVQRLPGPGRSPRRADHDAESLARDPATGRMWAGLEGVNAILRLDPGAQRVERRVRPRAMRRWPANGGAETLARLADGRFLVISEEASRRPGARVALLFAHDPTEPGPPPVTFAYAPPAGFDPTDATELPDGRIVVLNRHFAFSDGVAAAVTIFAGAAMRQGATVRPRVLARLRRPLAVDNMEALAITREGTETMLWLASDDNLSLLQRTLLLKFRLAE